MYWTYDLRVSLKNSGKICKKPLCGNGKQDREQRYRQMNGMELREMDNIIYPACRCCRDYERSGFIEGIKIGALLHAELTEE